MKNMRIHSVLTLLALIASMSLHAAPQTVKLTERFCEPTRLLVGCQVLDAAGTYTVEVTPDSIVEVNLQIGVPETKVEASIKKGEKFLFGCESFTEEGIHPVTFQSSWGCDSVVNLHLSYIACDTVKTSITQQLCEAQLPYTYQGAKEYLILNDTTIIDTIFDGSSTGCDSIATIQFKVNRLVLDSKADTTLCNVASIKWRGMDITESGTYYDTVRYAQSGCDSAYYTLSATFNRVMLDSKQDTMLCAGSSMEWRGKMLTAAKTYYDTVRYAASGCDSAYYSIKLGFYKESKSQSSQTLCESQLPFTYKSYQITSDTTIIDTIVGGAATGCDSIATIQFKVNRFIEQVDEQTVLCPGTSIKWRGMTLKEEKTYYDTVRYAKSGCDSAYYSMQVTFAILPVSEVSRQICQSDLRPFYLFKGAQRNYKIYNDTIVNDTIFGGSAAGCDSVAKISFTILRPVVEQNSDTVICPGSSFEWHGQICDKATTYRDAKPYAATGCDSVLYTMKVTFYVPVKTISTDTLCLSAAQEKYPHLNITRTGTYRDTLTSVVSGCDSIVTRLIVLLQQPVVPELRYFDKSKLSAVCGRAITDKGMNEAIAAAIQQAKTPEVANATFWLELQLADKAPFEKLASQIMPVSGSTIQLRLALETECGDVLYSTPVAYKVENPSPDNTDGLDNLPASNKYNHWLLMIDRNAIKDTYSLDPAEEDVVWYRIQNEQDPVGNIAVDAPVGTGYYYTADQSLYGRYYAVIYDNDECHTIWRTEVLTCNMSTKDMKLAPRSIRPGETMTLSNLDPTMPTVLTFFQLDGKKMDQRTIEGEPSCLLQPAQPSGMYLLHVSNGDREESFKYIITK